ncbi:LOW QUALITY PROTEIN: solute carrier family 22 member 7-like [Leucoraja erinacea]|uniref:LOW QUALITY PROTEIN: solute carrier family 22 member 7-like n=1 Tax=Leucoraja erinaceus TaxID=7782 RepID=UPI002454C9D1|nr:LOW QUALITY PROTEIN: solute carrier family 22 member 7-like [Leucoraja erinacea]
MDVDDVLRECGGFGRFQLLLLALLSLARLPLPWHFLLHIFLSAVPPHHCRSPHQPTASNLSRDPHLTPADPGPCRALPPSLNHSSLPCTSGWEYDTSQFTATIATEWDLVCDRRSLNQAAGTFFFLGVMLGGPIFGYLSDRYGRRRLLLLGCLVTAIFGTIAAVSTGFTMFVISRFLSGLGLTAINITAFTLAVEWTDVKHRAQVGAVCSLAWCVGNMSLALMAFLLRDWRWLQLAVSTPCLLFAAACWWVPESARWQLSVGQMEGARSGLLTCARLNHTPPPHTVQELEKLQSLGRAPRPSPLALVRTRQMCRITLCSGMVWMGVSLSYYGLSFSVSGLGLGLGLYLTHFTYAAVEMPGKLLAFLLLERLGRRWTQAGLLLLTASVMGLRCLLTPGQQVPLLVLGIVGKGSAEGAFTTALFYITELFPTSLRQSGLGYTSLMGRLAASATPLVMLLDEVWVFLPSLIFISVTLLAAAMSLLLPETRHVPLPQTVGHVEDSGHRHSRHRHTAGTDTPGTDTLWAPTHSGHRHTAGTDTPRAPTHRGHRHTAGTDTLWAPTHCGHRHTAGTDTLWALAHSGHRHTAATGTAGTDTPRAPTHSGHRHTAGTDTLRAPTHHGHRHTAGTDTPRALTHRGHRQTAGTDTAIHCGYGRRNGGAVATSVTDIALQPLGAGESQTALSEESEVTMRSLRAQTHIRHWHSGHRHIVGTDTLRAPAGPLDYC